MIKKFLAIAAVAAMLIACGEPEENKPQGGTNNGGNTEQPGGNENQEPEEPEFDTLIDINGDFADWDALTAEQYVEATLPDGLCLYPVLKTFKMCADGIYLYVFLEFDPRGVYTDVTDEYSGVRYLDLFIDEDNDPATGRYYAWSNCASYMLQGGFHGVTTPYNPSVDLYTGEDGSAEWLWEDLGVYGLITSSQTVTVSEDTAYFECSLLRALFPVEMEGTIGVGAIVETEGWSTIGQLPQYAVEDAPAAVEENDTTTEDDTTTEGGETEGGETEGGETEGGEEDTATRPTMLYITLPPMAE